jgi:hypothetical protein
LRCSSSFAESIVASSLGRDAELGEDLIRRDPEMPQDRPMISESIATLINITKSPQALAAGRAGA